MLLFCVHDLFILFAQVIYSLYISNNILYKGYLSCVHKISLFAHIYSVCTNYLVTSYPVWTSYLFCVQVIYCVQNLFILCTPLIFFCVYVFCMHKLFILCAQFIYSVHASYLTCMHKWKVIYSVWTCYCFVYTRFQEIMFLLHIWGK